MSEYAKEVLVETSSVEELLGHEDTKDHDGSWTEWGNLVNVPIER